MLLEFVEFMTPEIDYDYYNNITENLFECPVINPKHPLRTSKFLVCRVGGLIVRTTNTEFFPPAP